MLAVVSASSFAGDPALRTAALDAGGGRAAVGDMTLDASLGALGGNGADATVKLKSGYAGQLYDLATLTVVANPTNVPEAGTRQLTVLAMYDDGTVGPLDSTPRWSVAWGPLTDVGAGGLVTAGIVYEDTPAAARATCESLEGTVVLLVLDSTPDNYGTYAADGLPDGWQVQNFGVDNPHGLAGADPDEDTVPNSGEYAGDTDPNDDTSYLRLTAVMPEGAAAVRVAWRGGRLATQYLERSTSLDAPDWRTIHTNLPPTSVDENHLDAAASGPTGFYRLRAVR
jgi:hypothetical protein